MALNSPETLASRQAVSMPEPDFKIPSKDLKIIRIQKPDARSYLEVASTSIRETKGPPSDHPIERAKSLGKRQDSYSSKPSQVENHNGQLPVATNARNAQSHTSHTERGVSILDIHSRNYVPLWLRAVNESNASLQSCEAFPTIDFTRYIATLAGYEWVRTVEPVSPPPPIQTSPMDEPLTIDNYANFWLTNLQNEFAAQDKQLQSFFLYNHLLTPAHGRPNYFRLRVPGLREHAPRIDLGDVVHIRSLLPKRHDTEFAAQAWIDYGRQNGFLCPGFSGLLYDPRVWEIDRANETITFKIDGYDKTLSCNIIFLLQESKVEPICRAVRLVTNHNAWLRRILFPNSTDGELQTSLSQAYFDIPWIDDLNWEQKKAVHSIVTRNYGSLPYLISGPPGTGKTKTLVETALQLISESGHILVCAPSDGAADTLALRLAVHLKPNELFRLNGWTRTFAEVPDRLLSYTHSEGLSFSLPPIEQMLSFRIVVTTCRDADLLNRARLTNASLSRLFNGVGRLLTPECPKQPLHWKALLLDEGAQATEPDVLIPLSVVMPPDDHQSPQFIAAGDQYQLGPKLATRSDLEISLFQRLFDCPAYAEHPLSRGNGMRPLTAKLLPILRPAFSNLVRNYRSHPAILSVPSSLFYNDSLIPEKKTSEDILSWSGWSSKDQIDKWPVLFQQNDTEDIYESIIAGDGSGTGTLYNPGEAEIALTLVRSLLQHADSGPNVLRQNEIMVMSPFRAQVSQLRKIFRQNKLFEVSIGPLEAFQGLESRIVVICTTRTRLGANHQMAGHHVRIDQSRLLGIVDEPQRLNVAMTRAQEGLIVVGNAHCLTSTGDASWLKFLDYCRRNNCFKAPQSYVWPDLGGPYAQGRLERGLIYHALGKANAANVESAKVTQPGKSRIQLGLKGPRKDMDEDMWQFKELAQMHDSENIDMTFDWDKVRNEADNTFDEEEENADDQDIDGFDRNLSQEIHQECATQ